MTVDYPLENFDSATFQQVAVAIAREVIGPGVEAYGEGPDGGRDATFEGRISWSNTPGHGEDIWDGYAVVQVKHRAARDYDPERNLRWLKDHISRELDSWSKADPSSRRPPEYLLFITNAKLSPAIGGGIETIDKHIREKSEALRKRGLKSWKVWHREQVVSFLIQHDKVRRQFPSLLTTAAENVVARLESLVRYQQEPIHDLLISHALDRMRYEQWVNFTDAGADERRPIHGLIVDLPVLLADGSRAKALRSLIASGEKVLRRSLTQVSEPRHIVLTGAPGNGKSTLTQYFVQLYRSAFLAREDIPASLSPVQAGIGDSLTRLGLLKPRQQRWPIHIDLASWASSPLRDRPVLNWISHTISESLGQPVTAPEMRRWLRQWPWMVAFDGLDEVTDLAARRSILRMIATFVDEVDDADCDAFIIVTTRPGGYTEELSVDHFAQYELTYLSAEEAVEYGKLITGIRLSEDKDRADMVLERFAEASKEPATLRLLKTPLQVLVVTVILEQHRTLPVNRHGLFWAYFNTLFTREKAKSTDLAAFLTEFQHEVTYLHEAVGIRLQIQSEIAENSRASLTLEELRKIADDRFKHIGYSDADQRRQLVRKMLDAATKRLVLLVQGEPKDDGSETVVFELRSLQELMASRWISNGSADTVRERLTALAPSPHWRNTWVFAAGRLFADDDEAKWNLVTEILPTLSDHDQWPSWLIPLAPGLAADLLDDGLAYNRPVWQQALLKTALSALSPPIPPDMAAIGRGLSVPWLGSTQQTIIRNRLDEAFGGGQAAQFAASRVVSESPFLSKRMTSQIKDLQVKVAPKGRNTMKLGELLRPHLVDLLGTLPVLMETALAELETVRTVEQKTRDGGTILVGYRPKQSPDWVGLIHVLGNSELRFSLQLAFDALEPDKWVLLHLAAREIYPVLARRPVGHILGVDGFHRP